MLLLVMSLSGSWTACTPSSLLPFSWLPAASLVPVSSEQNGFNSLAQKKINVTKKRIVCSWVNELNQLCESSGEHQSLVQEKECINMTGMEKKGQGWSSGYDAFGYDELLE